MIALPGIVQLSAPFSLIISRVFRHHPAVLANIATCILLAHLRTAQFICRVASELVSVLATHDDSMY